MSRSSKCRPGVKAGPGMGAGWASACSGHVPPPFLGQMVPTPQPCCQGSPGCQPARIASLGLSSGQPLEEGTSRSGQAGLEGALANALCSL